MLDFQAVNGVSGSVIGGTFLAAVLGPGFAILSIAVVLVVQTALFGDSGILGFGANVLNLGVIGAGLSALLLAMLSRLPQLPRLALTSWLSGLVVAVVAGLLLASEHWTHAQGILLELIGLHVWVGIGRAFATMALVVMFCGNSPWPSPGRAFRISSGTILFAALVLACFFAPYASQSPNPVETVVKNFGLGSLATRSYTPPLLNYSFSEGISNRMSIALCGLIGTLCTFGLARLVGSALLIPKASVTKALVSAAEPDPE
jgi:cobalt/nickel transport system permease protein